MSTLLFYLYINCKQRVKQLIYGIGILWTAFFGGYKQPAAAHCHGLLLAIITQKETKTKYSRNYTINKRSGRPL